MMKEDKIFTCTLDDDALTFFEVKDKEDHMIVSYPIHRDGLVQYVGIASVLFISNMLQEGWTLESVKIEKPKGED